MNMILVGELASASGDGLPQDVSETMAAPVARAMEAVMMSGLVNQRINDVFGCIRGTIADHFRFGQFFCGVVAAS